MVNLVNNTIKLLLHLLVISVLFSSCVASYNIANAGIDPIVFTKPVFRDSSTVTDYFGGKFTHSIDSINFNPNEKTPLVKCIGLEHILNRIMRFLTELTVIWEITMCRLLQI